MNTKFRNAESSAPSFLLAATFATWGIVWAMVFIQGCGSGGTDDTATTSTSSASETTTVRDCFFVEDSEGNLINVGEVGTPEGEDAASDAESFKSNITINNCGGDVHVSGDTITTTETNTNVDSNNTEGE